MLAALLAGLLQQANPEDVDVLTLKDGSTRSGRILSEAGGQIVLEALIKGSKGQVVGTGKVTIDAAQVASIKRASDEARKKASDRSAAFGARGTRRAEALSRMKLEPATIDFLKAWRVEGSHVVLESTCDVTFTKDVALCLEEVFAAYRSFFDIRRNADKKVKVHLFADVERYRDFQVKRHGGAVMNPAYYHVEQNYIACYNLAQKGDERRIRDEIVALERQIETYRADLANAERRLAALAADLRRKIQEAAAEERRAIKADGAGGKDARLQAVNRRERELLESLKTEETDVAKELAAEKRKALEAIESNRKVIERNEKVLAAQNRAMFETLYHEGFHAFASNYLWEGSGKAEFPRWLHEGMATYFEMSVAEAGELVHGAPHAEFLKLCREENVRSGLLPLEKLLKGGGADFVVTHRSQTARSNLFYAQSWALAHYLSSRASKQAIAAYVNDILSGKDPVASFETLAGKPCREVEAELKKHLDSLKAP